MKNECRKVLKPDSLKKVCPKYFTVCFQNSVVFGHFLEIAALDFANFAYVMGQE